jgi:hypothetical protein
MCVTRSCNTTDVAVSSETVAVNELKEMIVCNTNLRRMNVSTHRGH